MVGVVWCLFLVLFCCWLLLLCVICCVFCVLFFFVMWYFMFSNIFGKLFLVIMFGELYGLVIGCVIDGCLLGLEIDVVEFVYDLQCCVIGKSWYIFVCCEEDVVEILFGVYEGCIIGILIVLLICNIDQCSKDYSNIVQQFCFGYVDYSYWQKYGICDLCGGGCLFVCEIIMCVVVGVIVKKWLLQCYGVCVCGYLLQLGEIMLIGFDWLVVEDNLFFWLVVGQVFVLESYMDVLCKFGDLVGVCVNVVVDGVLLGWGELIYGKFDGELVVVLMSINVVKGVEIGDGFVSVVQKGIGYCDLIIFDGFVSNYVGGIFGGIFIGQQVIVLIVFKLIFSLCLFGVMVDVSGVVVEVIIIGCYDFCVGICVILIVEVMMVLVLMDQVLCYWVQCGDVGEVVLCILGSIDG